MSTQQPTSEQQRITWPRRRRADGTPIVGWTCDNCGHLVEAPYAPSRLERCPECGGNQQGVRGWTVEPFVEERRERLLDQLAEHWGLDQLVSDGEWNATCAVCGTDEDVSTCPGEDLDDLEYRCDDCRRIPNYWWQPGDHPSLLVRRWIETCDDCGAEFTGIFGVTFWYDHGRGHETEDKCLRCADGDTVRHYLERDY